jgi:hypothetical protein
LARYASVLSLGSCGAVLLLVLAMPVCVDLPDAGDGLKHALRCSVYVY